MGLGKFSSLCYIHHLLFQLNHKNNKLLMGHGHYLLGHHDIHYFKRYHEDQLTLMLIMPICTKKWHEIIFQNKIRAKIPKIHIIKLLTSMIQISYVTVSFMK